MAEKESKYTIRTEEEIERIRLSCTLVSRTIAEVKKFIQPGVDTLKLDKIAEEFIKDNGGRPAFKHYRPKSDNDKNVQPPFPGSLCVSINHEVVHGVPSEKKILQEGDIVSIDCGVELNGYYGDSAYTFPVGEVSPLAMKLLHITKESLYLGIQNAVHGKRMGDLSFAIEKHVKNNKFSVVKCLVGHGIGTELHEKPEVPNYGKRGNGIKLLEGMVIAIEPMVNAGKDDVNTDTTDQWTVFAVDKLPSAHYEHTVVIRRGKAQILTSFEALDN